MNAKNLVKYLALAGILLLTYNIQLYFFTKYNINAYTNLIIRAYLVNAIVVVLFFLFIDIFKSKYKDQIGFAFMAASMLKFVLFFIFIYPTYKSDNTLSKHEILTFFIPYTVCLIYESIITSKILNNLKF